jgi:hypothetical protein
MLKEVAELKHKTMNEAIQFDNRKMFERSGEPAISFKHLLSAAASTNFNRSTKKINNKF